MPVSRALARGRDAGNLVQAEVGHVASVGTVADNDVVLADDAVSRYHPTCRPPGGARDVEMPRRAP